jgi:peptidoglycan/LPS O-acetylase OafA/YrhL
MRDGFPRQRFEPGYKEDTVWSYAIYLAHLPVSAVAQAYFFKGWKDSLKEPLPLFVLQIGATIMVSGVLYRFFERRMTRLREPVGRSIVGPRSGRTAQA